MMYMDVEFQSVILKRDASINPDSVLRRDETGPRKERVSPTNRQRYHYKSKKKQIVFCGCRKAEWPAVAATVSHGPCAPFLLDLEAQTSKVKDVLSCPFFLHHVQRYNETHVFLFLLWLH